MVGQAVYAQVLADAALALGELGVPFHLLFGTALGAYRDREFIEHDYDIDLGIHHQDHVEECYYTFERYRFTSCRWFGKLDDGYVLQFLHQTRVRLDINLVYERSDGYYAATYGSLCARLPGGKCWYRNSKYSLSEIEFAGGTYLVPGEDYYAETYGDDWRTPKELYYNEQSIIHDYKSLVGRELLVKLAEQSRPPGEE
jgi:hypothetical protein